MLTLGDIQTKLTAQVPGWARWVAIVALVVAAASAGRFSAPTAVEERISVQTVYRDRVIEKRVELAAKVETRVVYRDRTVSPEGAVHEVEIEKTGAVTEVARAEAKVEVREVEKRVEVERRVEIRPAWRAGVLVGASLKEPLLPIAGPLVLGAQVEHRIVGGVSAGAWVSTSGAAGASLSFEW